MPINNYIHNVKTAKYMCLPVIQFIVMFISDIESENTINYLGNRNVKEMYSFAANIYSDLV